MGPENPSQPYTGRLVPVSSRRSPLIMGLPPTHLWHFPDRANIWPLDQPRHRTIHVQCPVSSPGMVVREVGSQEPPEMALVQDNHVIQALTTDAPDEPLDIGVLPRTSWGDEHFFNPHIPHPLPKRSAVNAVPIVQQIAWCFFPRKRVHHLLGSPLGSRMFRQIEVDDAGPLVGQDEQHEEYFVGHRGYDKEIEGDQILHMVVEKGLPRRRWRLGWPYPLRLHRGLS